MKSNFDSAKWFMLLLVFVVPTWGSAQRSDESVRVKVHKTQEGHTLQIEEDLPAGDAQDLEQLMKKYGMTDELQELKPGEEVEIVIRRKQTNEASSDPTDNVTIEMERKGTPPSTPPVAATPPPVERKKAFLGVHYEMNYGETIGSHITKVEPGTPAYRAGLLPGDVITKADEVNLFALDDLSNLISTKKAGDKVKLTFVRNGKISTTYVTLAERDEAFFRNNPGGGPTYQIEEEYDLDSESKLNVDNDIIRKPPVEATGPLLGVLMIRSDAKMILNGVETVIKPEGAIVDEVIPNSAAIEIGLRKGDKILVINGRHIKLSTDVTSLIAAMKPGDHVDLEYMRDGVRHVGAGTLKSRKDFDLPTDVALNGTRSSDSDDIFERAHRLMDEARARTSGTSTVREFRMVITMDELSPAEAQVLSAKTGQPIKAVSDLDLRSLNLSPNPSTGKFHLGFELPLRGTMTIDVMDMNGGLVYTEQIDEFQGRYLKDFDISQEAKGIYVMRIAQNGKAFTRKIVTQ